MSIEAPIDRQRSMSSMWCTFLSRWRATHYTITIREMCCSSFFARLTAFCGDELPYRSRPNWATYHAFSHFWLLTSDKRWIPYVHIGGTRRSNEGVTHGSQENPTPITSQLVNSLILGNLGILLEVWIPIRSRQRGRNLCSGRNLWIFLCRQLCLIWIDW